MCSERTLSRARVYACAERDTDKDNAGIGDETSHTHEGRTVRNAGEICAGCTARAVGAPRHGACGPTTSVDGEDGECRRMNSAARTAPRQERDDHHPARRNAALECTVSGGCFGSRERIPAGRARARCAPQRGVRRGRRRRTDPAKRVCMNVILRILPNPQPPGAALTQSLSPLAPVHQSLRGAPRDPSTFERRVRRVRDVARVSSTTPYP